MDENGTKLVPLGGYPRELREKALEMYRQGYKKVKIAEILGVGNTTVRRWTNFGNHPYFKPHPLEDKQKAIDLAKSGVSRKEIAERLGISYFTIAFWCRGINTWQKQTELPVKLRKKARKMVRSGMTKREVSGLLNLSYSIICYLTADIHNSNSRISRSAERIIAEVIEKGYFFPKKAQLNTCRIIKQSLGLRLTRLNGKWILYQSSEKNNAMKAMLEKSKFNYLSNHRLATIKRLFYGNETKF